MATPINNSDKQGPLVIRIKDKWVNVEVWKRTHPGGSMSLERFRGKDATDAFASLHSPEAWEMVNKMKAVSAPSEYREEEERPATIAFRKWRAQLEKDGWFERTWAWDAFYVSIITVLAVVGTLLAYDYPLLASLLIGVAMQQAGWIGHDYVHGRGKVSYVLGRVIGACWNGFSSEWWSEKHNKHHVHTNQVGIDDDIANDPILHLYIPSEDKEFWLRPYQHIYYHVVYAFLYVSWRIQSVQYAWAHNHRMELALIALNYVWLLTLPLKVAIGSVLIGGFLVAEIVTATHQSEEMIEGASYNFVEDQFATTRDVHMSSSFMNWLWGGMQFQLVHHLFPTMPKYRYSAMVRHIERFAKENGIEYRHSGMLDIVKMNYNTMKKYAGKDKQ
jgi:fatty acid desaturase